jgi:hypothetical protein
MRGSRSASWRQGIDVSVVAVDGVEGEAALVAQPPVVHRLGVHAEQARQAVARGLHRDATPDRAGRAGALDLLEVPGARVKRYGFAVSAPTGQICTVLPENVESKGVVGEGRDLDEVTATGEGDLGVARDVGG